MREVHSNDGDCYKVSPADGGGMYIVWEAYGEPSVEVYVSPECLDDFVRILFDEVMEAER